MRISRRAALSLGAVAALPRVAIGQSDNRPTITVAVQRIANSNTLDNLREQSNVGERTSLMFNERLIELDYLGRLGQVPGLAVQWRRVDDSTMELKLREGVKFHNGDSFTAEDVAFSFGPDRDVRRHPPGGERPHLAGGVQRHHRRQLQEAAG